MLLNRRVTLVIASWLMLVEIVRGNMRVSVEKGPSSKNRVSAGTRGSRPIAVPRRRQRGLVDGAADLRGLGMPSREFVEPVKGIAEQRVLMGDGEI